MDTDSIYVETKVWIREIDPENKCIYMDIDVYADNKYVTGETNRKVYLNQAEWFMGWVDVPSNSSNY